MEIVTLLVIGLIAGGSSGLFGVGGGILIVPALVLLRGMVQQKAQGTSLAILLLPVGILAVKNYWDKGHVEIKDGLYISLGFLVGSFLTSKIAVGLDPNLLRKMFACFLATVSVYLFFK
jgi:hypothetical protein